MDLAITKMSSKGQIVIPVEMRKDFKEGDKFVIIKTKNRLLLKKVVDKTFEEDLEFARRTENALKIIKDGKGVTMEFDNFIEEMKKW